jgi:hypothetical protein
MTRDAHRRRAMLVPSPCDRDSGAAGTKIELSSLGLVIDEGIEVQWVDDIVIS